MPFFSSVLTSARNVIQNTQDILLTSTAQEQTDEDMRRVTLAAKPHSNYVDRAGYLNSKKGFSVTETSWGTMAYIVNTRATSTGAELVIETFYNNDLTASSLKRGLLLIPNVPYRFYLQDAGMMNDLKTVFSRQSTDYTGSGLLFNPDIFRGNYGQEGQVDFGTINTYLPSVERFEINLGRGEYSSFIGRQTRLFKSSTGAHDLYFTASKIYTDDYQASVIAIPRTGSTTIDDLYIAVSSRVTIIGDYRYGRFGSLQQDRQIYWSTPIVLKLEITKPNFAGTSGSRHVVPLAWSYPFELGNGQDITSDIYGSLKLWNKAVIQGRHVKGQFIGTEENAFWPMDYGALCDIIWNDTESRVEAACARSEEPDIVGNSASSTYTLTNFYQSSLPFSTDNSYNHLNRSVRFSTTDYICENIVIDHKDPIVYVASTIRAVSEDTVHPRSALYTFTKGASINSFSSRKGILNADNIDLCVSKEGKVYLSVTDHSQVMYGGYGYAVFEILGSDVKYSFNSVPISFAITAGTIGGGSSLVYKYIYDTYDNIRTLVRPFVSNAYYSQRTNNRGIDPSLETKTFGPFILSNRSYGAEDVITVNNVTDDPLNFFLHTFITNQTLGENNNPGYIESVQTSGLLPTEWFIATYSKITSGSKGIKINTVSRQGIDEFRLGLPTIEYWRDPVFGSGAWKNDDYQWDEDRGIALLVNITGCYGIKSSSTLTVNSFDTTLKPASDKNRPGGIAINTDRRADLNFRYSGDEKTFKNTFSTWRGGYWAVPDEKFEVQCTYNGKDILSNSVDGVANFQAGIWHYDETGYFNMNIPLQIDPPIDDFNREFTDPNYVLSGVQLTVSCKNEFYSLLDRDTFSIDIDPPNATGWIETDSYKTIGDIEFTYFRNATINSDTYTEIHDIVSYVEAQNTQGIQTATGVSLRGDGSNTGIYKVYSSSALTRGMGIHYTYVPKLYEVKPSTTNNSSEITKAITYCNGHRYSIDDVKIYLGLSGTFGSNIIDKFNSERDPYQYIDVDNESMHVKVEFDINHENWSLSTPRSSYPDINVYPGISGLFLYAAKGLEYINNFLPVPGDSTRTYPNLEGPWGKNWVLYPAAASKGGVVAASGIWLPGTSASLNNQEMTLYIQEPGRYRIYLTVEDEFGQFSNFCLTNPSFYFNHPFEGS